MSDPLAPVDRLTVQVVVDNVTDSLSTVPQGVMHETACLAEHGMHEVSGEALCCAHWGLSLAITVERAGQRRAVIFDGGPEDYAVERNAARLGVDFGTVEAIVLSHGHWDHAGGLPAALRAVVAARGPGVEFHVHPQMFRQRAFALPGGRVLPFKPIPQVADLEGLGARVVVSRQAQALLGGAVYLSGEIPRVTAYERGLPGHLCRGADGADWEPDPLIVDERFLAVDVAGKGLVVFTACSHAGVVNVAHAARAAFPDRPLHALVGGFHLSGPGVEEIIPQTVEDLAGFGFGRIVPGHCTGWRAVAALAARLGDQVVVPSAVGRRYAF